MDLIWICRAKNGPTFYEWSFWHLLKRGIGYFAKSWNMPALKRYIHALTCSIAYINYLFLSTIILILHLSRSDVVILIMIVILFFRNRLFNRYLPFLRFFIMYLINKDETEYTGQETFVWDMYQSRCWDFFP